MTQFLSLMDQPKTYQLIKQALWLVSVIFISTGIAHSQSGVSANAPSVSFYVGMSESCCGEDPHPVHGIETGDGGYLVVGKTAASNDSWGGFAAKIGPPKPLGTGEYLEPNESAALRWSIELSTSGGKATYLNAASTQTAVFLAGLRANAQGNIDMYLAKHALQDGELIWEKSFPAPQGSGAIEAIQLTNDGGLIGVGIINAPQEGLEGFKSFGNPYGGQAHSFYLSAQQVSSNNAPESPLWARTYSDYETAKSVREIPFGGFIILAGNEDGPASLLRVDQNGEPMWSQSYPNRFEVTDVALHMNHAEHLGYTFTGHGGENGVIDGQLTRVDLEGDVIFARTFGNPRGGINQFQGLDRGDPRLIYDECWGIQGLADGGVIVGCGTGIEGCDLVEDQALRQQCETDPRRTWRGYVVRFDSEGAVVWQRMDSFVEPNTNDGVADSASEYVALLSNGGFLSIVDQGFGIGLLALNPEGTEPSDSVDHIDDEGELLDLSDNPTESENSDDQISEPHQESDAEELESNKDLEAESEAHHNADGESTGETMPQGESETVFAYNGGGCTVQSQQSMPLIFCFALASFTLLQTQRRKTRNR